MLKVMTFVGTRPEIIKLSCVLPALDKAFEHTLVDTGQNGAVELNGNFFDELGLRHPDLWYAPWHYEGPCGALAEMLTCCDDALRSRKPDAVLILGDTNSAVAAAYAAKRAHVPIFHMEAGNRCFDERVPEEANRRVVDHLADINMPYTEHARTNLLREGIAPDRIIKTGSPMLEVLSKHMPDLGAYPRSEFVVSCHREENVDDPARLAALVSTINALAARGTVLFSCHPRTRSRLGDVTFPANVEVLPPLGFKAYVAAQHGAGCVISDSGTLTEEAAILGFPAVMIRQAHERPEGMDEGVVVMSDLNAQEVLAAVDLAVSKPRGHRVTPHDYSVWHVSDKVVNTIASYTGYARRTVYRK
jgi:UDP-N-acetylglucosamine 2-epimerase (non-hydrolysing)